MGNNLRFHPCVREAKEWLRNRLIGDVLWAQFTCAMKSGKNLSDGIILSAGAHEVDLAMHLLGPLRVGYATTRCTDDLRDDMVDFTVVHHFGARSSFHLDWVTPIYTRDFRIMGTEGVIYCDLERRVLWRDQLDPKLPDVTYFHHYIGPGSWDDDYLDEMSAFIGRIDGKSTDGASGRDGLDTLYALLDVRKKVGLA
jgi:predicted dehydrogenase